MILISVADTFQGVCIPAVETGDVAKLHQQTRRL